VVEVVVVVVLVVAAVLLVVVAVAIVVEVVVVVVALVVVAVAIVVVVLRYHSIKKSFLVALFKPPVRYKADKKTVMIVFICKFMCDKGSPSPSPRGSDNNSFVAAVDVFRSHGLDLTPFPPNARAASVQQGCCL